MHIHMKGNGPLLSSAAILAIKHYVSAWESCLQNRKKEIIETFGGFKVTLFNSDLSHCLIKCMHIAGIG